MWAIVDRRREQGEEGRQQTSELRNYRQAYRDAVLNYRTAHVEQERKVKQAREGRHAAQAWRTQQGALGRQESGELEKQIAEVRAAEVKVVRERVQDVLRDSRNVVSLRAEAVVQQKDQLRTRVQAERFARQEHCSKLREQQAKATKRQAAMVRARSATPHLARDAVYQQRLAQAMELRKTAQELEAARQSAQAELKEQARIKCEARRAAKYMGADDTQAMRRSQSFTTLHRLSTR